MTKNLRIAFALFFAASSLLQAQTAAPKVKDIYGQISVALNSEYLLPLKDNAVLLFGNANNSGLVARIDTGGLVSWAKSYDFAAPAQYKTKFISSVLNHDSTTFVAGAVIPPSGSTGTGFCAKLKPNGDTLWCRRLVDNTYISYMPMHVSATRDSGYVICGGAILSSTVSGPWQSAFIAKVSRNGTLSWLKTIHASFYNNCANAVRQTPDSGFIVLGQIPYTSNATSCALLLKLDKNGSVSWSRRFYETNNPSTYGIDISVENNGYTCLITSSKGCLLRTDLNGNMTGMVAYNLAASLGTEYERDLKMDVLPNKDRLLVCKADAAFGGWALVTDSTGNPKWNVFPYIAGIDMVQAKDKTFRLTGSRVPYVVRTGAPYWGDLNFFIADSLGNNKATCYFKGSSTTSTLSISDNTLTCTTGTSGFFAGISPAVAALSLASDTGCMKEWIGIKELNAAAARVYYHAGAGSIHIALAKQQGRNTKLELYSLTGQKVLSREWNAPSGEMTLDAGTVAPGVYLYALWQNGTLIRRDKLLIAD